MRGVELTGPFVIDIEAPPGLPSIPLFHMLRDACVRKTGRPPSQFLVPVRCRDVLADAVFGRSCWPPGGVRGIGLKILGVPVCWTPALAERVVEARVGEYRATWTGHGLLVTPPDFETFGVF